MAEESHGSGLPGYEVEFALDGTVVRETGLAAAVTGNQVDDVFVFSHGWNNSTESARRLYTRMFGLLSDILMRSSPQTASRTAVVGLFWPSLLFPEDDPTGPKPASATSGRALADALKPAFPGKEGTLASIGQLLEGRGGAAELVEFHDLAKTLVTTPSLDPEVDSGEQATADLPAGTVVNYYSGWPSVDMAAAEAIQDPVEGLWQGALQVLRTLSYYEMKNRAGVVGRDGLGKFLSTLAKPDGDRPRVHLLGHSFGARLVSYTLAGLANGLVGKASPIKSLLLIQGAFSHFSFTARLPFDPSRGGVLARYADRVDGPLLATFSSFDRAVGWWYPLASMLKRQDANSQADLLFRWSAMGADGYQLDGAVTLPLRAEGIGYEFNASRFYRLNANGVIKAIQSPLFGAHSDICHPEVAWAAVAAAGVKA